MKWFLGHRVVVHGCKIRKGSLIGISAIVLNNAEVGEESINRTLLPFHCDPQHVSIREAGFKFRIVHDNSFPGSPSPHPSPLAPACR